MTGGDQRWVLAVDVRPAAGEGRTATGDDDGVRVRAAAGPVPPDLTELVRSAAGGRGRVAPLAVVVVHPATWDDDRAAGAADEVGGAVGQALGEDAAEWPWPVPLNALEASAWRALEFGLLPARARVAVVDAVTGEAGVVDREYGRLAAAGRPERLRAPASDEQLVALARRVLDAAPAGPPFAGVVLAGADGPGGSSSALSATVARLTGRPPLVPGDPATVPLLGAASLAWAVATASSYSPPAPHPPAARPGGDRADPGGRGTGGHPGARGSAPGAGVGPGGGERPALPGGPARRRLPPWARWLLALAVLAVVAGVAGLLVHRDRTTPSPFTYTCPNGQVVAFSYECDRLAPSSTP